MRLVIDMQGAQTGSRFRGIGRYTISLTQAIVELAEPHHEVILIANAQMPESAEAITRAFDGLLDTKYIRIFDVTTNETEGSWANTASESIREAFIASMKPDALLITSMVEGYWDKAVTSAYRLPTTYKTAAILYDLIPLLHADTYLTSPDFSRFYAKKIESLKNVDLLLGISESSCKEAIDHLSTPLEKIENISAAIGPDFRPFSASQETAKAFLESMFISRKFILYAPGGFDPRKNFERLIAAYSQLPAHIRGTHQLVIVSKLSPDHQRQIKQWMDEHDVFESELILPGYVNDENLIKLYSLTTLFVFPSLHEGFGLPVLEAMACGAPTIGSACTSIPEVIGFEAALFDPLSTDSIRSKMAQALTDKDFWEQLKAHSTLQAQKFTWHACATKAWEHLLALSADAAPDKATVPATDSEDALFASITEHTQGLTPTEADLMQAARCIVFNEKQKQPQLFLDISVLANTDARSGIQRVVRSILLECINNPPKGFNVVPIRFDGDRYHSAEEAASKICSTPLNKTDEIVDFHQGDIYLCLDLLMHFGGSLHTVHRDMSLRGVQLNYIVYDILPLKNPEWWDPIIAPQFRCWIDEICKTADNLICISGAVADELRDWQENNRSIKSPIKQAILSFHLGAELSTSLPSKGIPDEAALIARAMENSTSFLMVSTLEPRKGHAQAIDAFELLWAKDTNACLIIIGKLGWKTGGLAERISGHAENGKRLFWLQNASDEFLEKMYEEADCLIMASLGEGFGLPLVEAAQHKLPIIARDLPVLREVGQEHAHYFTGLEAIDLSTEIENWIELRKMNEHPKSDHMPWLSWKSSTTQLLAAMQLYQ